MTVQALESAAASRPVAERVQNVLPELIVIGATLFNGVLAFVNGNVTGLTQAPVVVAEVMFVTAALTIVVTHLKRGMQPWFVLIGLFVAFMIARSLWAEAFDVKYLRDVMIIPIFVTLGMTVDPRRLGRVFIIIQIVMMIFLVLEAVNLDAYSSLFKIQDYYINTRGFTEDDFWNKDSDLFVSATRPDGSFLSFVDLHRLSSIFLEPVSLGNYCMVVLAFLCACWVEIGWKTRWFLVVTTVLAMVGCDGRLAMASALPMIVCCAIAPKLPRYSALAYIPGTLALAFALVSYGDFQPGGDDFPGRIAHTVYLLRGYDIFEYLGMSDEFLSKAVDSGIAYLITTQSIFIVIALWLSIALTSAEDRPEKTRIVHAVMIYVAMNMMVSFALLTIKTAALLWFTYGSVQGRRASPARLQGRRSAAGTRPRDDIQAVPGLAAFGDPAEV